MENIESLRAFVRVVEVGSFSEAGRQLDMAPSSVSRQINEIEETIGARLFHRTTRKLSLTEAGRTYHERIVQILQDLDEAGLAVSQLDGSPSGVLRITAPAGLNRRHIIPAVAEFREKYPAVKVMLLVTDQYLDIVDEGLDLAIRIGQLSDSSLVVKKIADARRVVCASPKYLKVKGIPKVPENLLGHSCINFGSHYRSYVWTFKSGKGKKAIKVSGSLVVDDGESLVAAAVSGQGIIAVPHWLVGGELKQGLLKEILTEHPLVPQDSPIYVVYPHHRHLPPKVRFFIDFIANKFRNECKWDCSAYYHV
ncbi:MAG: LysR family transcriptional regulator [Gammaproteobacteria bacterium]|nr:LysR family transcriptional regulator [Gammaproteobacteria bacterium]